MLPLGSNAITRMSSARLRPRFKPRSSCFSRIEFTVRTLSFAVVCCASSNVARDRPVVRRGASAEVQNNLVDITPSPAFRRIVALDDRMAGLVKVLGCMTVRRAVAAADMAAGPAEAQMHPRRADLQTLLAAEGTWRDVTDASGVHAFVCHQSLPTVAGATAPPHVGEGVGGVPT